MVGKTGFWGCGARGSTAVVTPRGLDGLTSLCSGVGSMDCETARTLNLSALPAVGTVTAVVRRATITAMFRAGWRVLEMVIAHQQDDGEAREVWLPARGRPIRIAAPRLFLGAAAISRTKWNCLLQRRQPRPAGEARFGQPGRW